MLYINSPVIWHWNYYFSILELFYTSSSSSAPTFIIYGSTEKIVYIFTDVSYLTALLKWAAILLFWWWHKLIINPTSRARSNDNNWAELSNNEKFVRLDYCFDCFWYPTLYRCSTRVRQPFNIHEMIISSDSYRSVKF
jgi:hypothetical protein